jgi:hypothetical protein
MIRCLQFASRAVRGRPAQLLGIDLEAIMQASEHEQVETQLLAFVRKLERNYYDWRVVHLHLSALKPRNRRDYQLRIAAREFDGLVRKFKSELFQVSNGDIFFMVSTPPRARKGKP